MLPENISSSQLKDRLDNLRLLAARLQGMREADIRQLEELSTKVGLAKARLSLSDEISRIFEAMQTRAHSRSVGTFELLLSAVLQDVLPDKGNIKLQLTNSNNSPNLDIYVENSGNVEDVLEGSGGAVTNVVSAGLRFAALTRTKNRRLMVLDEPDCWIKPARVPNFIKVIADVATSTKTQTLLISHHDPAYFNGRTNLIELTKDAAGIITPNVFKPLVSEWDSDSQPGLRSIQLINFRAHIDTTIPLFPGVTALIGDNDLGKSTALVASLKAVSYNESDDTVIRHGAKEAKIIIKLENNRAITWTRKLKGSPKVTYALSHGDTIIHEGKAPGRGSVPDWVSKELGISEVDDLDIQVGSQKNPVFLLDQTASRRAQLLSVGRESGNLVKIMDEWGSIKKTDRDTVKEGEARITRLTYRLARFAALDATLPISTKLAANFETVAAITTKAETLTRILSRFLEIMATLHRLEPELAILESIPEESPVLAETGQLQSVITRIANRTAFKDLVLPPDSLTIPELTDTLSLARMGAKLVQLVKYQPLFEVSLPELPEQPLLADDKYLQSTVNNVTSLTHSISSSETEYIVATKDERQAAADVQALQAKLGVCPLCNHKFEESHAHVE